MLQWLFGESKKQNSADSVNFSAGYDPSKGEHRDGVTAKIASLKQACWQRDKALYWWYGGLGLNILLLANNVYGFVSAGCLTGLGAGAWYYSQSDEFTKQDKLFHDRLNELLAIYQGYLAKVGLEATHDEGMLGLLEAISPYVATKDLLPKRGTYPANFSDRFVALLAAPPHNMEPSVLKTDFTPPESKVDSLQGAILNRSGNLFAQNRFMECAKRVQGDVNRAFHAHPSPR